MTDRRVTNSRKNSQHDITAICSTGESWSPRLKEDAIKDIESGVHSYYVLIHGRRVDVHVVKGIDGKYLRTDPDRTSSNNLDNLPDC